MCIFGRGGLLSLPFSHTIRLAAIYVHFRLRGLLSLPFSHTIAIYICACSVEGTFEFAFFPHNSDIYMCMFGGGGFEFAFFPHNKTCSDICHFRSRGLLSLPFSQTIRLSGSRKKNGEKCCLSSEQIPAFMQNYVC